jgi:chromosome segregation ATPase
MDSARSPSPEAIASAVETLKAEGRKVTVRAVQHLVGGGHSTSTIYNHLNRLREETNPATHEPQEIYLPLVRAAAELVRCQIELATNDAMAEIDTLKSDLATLNQDLELANADKAEALVRLEERELAISKLGIELTMVKENLATAIDDSKKFMTEAVEAREKAAMLEGRLAGIEFERRAREAEPVPQKPDEGEKRRTVTRKNSILSQYILFDNLLRKVVTIVL